MKRLSSMMPTMWLFFTLIAQGCSQPTATPVHRVQATDDGYEVVENFMGYENTAKLDKQKTLIEWREGAGLIYIADDGKVPRCRVNQPNIMCLPRSQVLEREKRLAGIVDAYLAKK